MLIAYYRRPDGTIRTFHLVDKVHRETLFATVEKYNNDPRTRDRVTIVDYAPDSFEAHLFDVATKARRLSEETLRDLLKDLEDAQCQILDLLRAVEED